MPVRTPQIEVEKLNFAHGQNLVLQDVSFKLEQGDYAGLVGPNGGGKSTLLKILVGLLKPQSGNVSIEGVPVGKFKNKSKIGYVPQRIAQDSQAFPATVYEIVESGLSPQNIRGLFGQKKNQTIKQAMQIAGIQSLKDRLINSLSGGQKQRAYVARALVTDPSILILDEPFVGIDVAAQKGFYAFLKQLNQTRGLTVIFASHDINVITQEVKSILCLNKGLLCLDSPAQLHEPNVIETLYGKKVNHLHHSH